MLRCGLLGEKLGHSYSPRIHSLLGDYQYKLYEVAPDKLDDFLKSGEFDGLNVTIPYKKAVIPYCAELSPAAERIGSVNTLVRRTDGSLFGDNTDYAGFQFLVQESGVDLFGKKCLVLGSGGASLTAQTALKDLGGIPVVISRRGENNYDNLDRHLNASVIVNTTPVGMYPNVGKAPLDIGRFPKLEAVFDVVYNPARTQILLDAEKLGLKTMNGLPMLVAQAKEAAERFTGAKIPDEKNRRIWRQLQGEMENIVLVGMPGCGKSTVGMALAKKLDRRFVDADQVTQEKAGKSIPEIFAKDGEAAFRKLETEALASLGKESGLIIATGGGCVTRPENYPLLHQNGRIFLLNRAVSKLPKEGRPLSQKSALSEMYEKRLPMYLQFADFEIDNDEDLDKTLSQILACLGGK